MAPAQLVALGRLPPRGVRFEHRDVGVVVALVAQEHVAWV
jgi:hypothetical protein